MSNETQIIQDCLKQDRAAQKKFYELYSGKLFVVALRYMKDRESAQDVLQDSFVKIFRYLDTFRFDSPLEAWLRKIVVNTALKALKKDKKLTQSLETGKSGDVFLKPRNEGSFVESVGVAHQPAAIAFSTILIT